MVFMPRFCPFTSATPNRLFDACGESPRLLCHGKNGSVCAVPIVIDCGGETVIRGTRVTLRTVLASLADGAAADEILADFPTLKTEDVRAVIAFAAAFGFGEHEAAEWVEQAIIVGVAAINIALRLFKTGLPIG